jgi:hypothetical protein
MAEILRDFPYAVQRTPNSTKHGISSALHLSLHSLYAKHCTSHLSLDAAQRYEVVQYCYIAFAPDHSSSTRALRPIAVIQFVFIIVQT